jgi:hypothetical protein
LMSGEPVIERDRSFEEAGLGGGESRPRLRRSWSGIHCCF